MFSTELDFWIRRLTSPAPTDRSRIEAAVDRMYARSDRSRPWTQIWARSPVEALPIASHLGPTVGWGGAAIAIRHRIERQAERAVDEATWAALRRGLGEPLRLRIARLEAELRMPWENRTFASFGRHDADWIAMVRWVRNHRGVPIGDLDPFLDLLDVGWWWPFPTCVLLTELPVRMSVDEEGRLHGRLEYSDGIESWHWHGVEVSARVGRGEFSVTDIPKEPNVEVRRAMIERFGPDRYLRLSGARRIHQDRFGELWRSDLRDDEPLVMVKVVNSTPEPDGTRREYFLRVPPQTRTARAAVAWTFGVPESDYLPSRET